MNSRLRNNLAHVWERVWQTIGRTRRGSALAVDRATMDQAKWSQAKARAHFWTELRAGQREAASGCTPDHR